jgi:hypothetical protein
MTKFQLHCPLYQTQVLNTFSLKLRFICYPLHICCLIITYGKPGISLPYQDKMISLSWVIWITVRSVRFETGHSQTAPFSLMKPKERLYL